MAHELIDAVTATPVGPVTIGHGQTLDITGSFSLDGASPGSPTTSTYTIQVSRVVSPGVYATVFGTPVSPATAGTNYTMTIPAAELSIGSRTFVATATLTTDAPHFQIVHSNEIQVRVVAFREEEAPSTTWAEEQAPATTWTEEQAPATTWTEEQPPSTTWTEEQAPSTTWTEEEQP